MEATCISSLPYAYVILPDSKETTLKISTHQLRWGVHFFVLREQTYIIGETNIGFLLSQQNIAIKSILGFTGDICLTPAAKDFQRFTLLGQKRPLCSAMILPTAMLMSIIGIKMLSRKIL